MDSFAAFESRLGHCFADRSLLREALTHPSYFNERPEEGPHNQRLEFLGDSVLGLIVTETLYNLHPTEPEGVLSRHRSVLTKGRCLAQLALELGLDSALLLGASEASNGGRKRASNLDDAFESVIGALRLDAGFERTREIVLAIYGPLGPRLALGGAIDNPKGRLQELIKTLHGATPLRYETVQIGGPDHAREFFAKVILADRVLGEGRGGSKKGAEEAAAAAALTTDLDAQ